ncbi:gp53-like domain-containing protein [Clostridium sporogenes]
MAYTKTNWVDGFTPLNSQNLNNIEDGIKQNESNISNVENQLNDYVLKSAIVQNKSSSGSIKLLDGITIQWGRAKYNSSNEGWQKGYIKAKFPESFTNEVYQIIATPYYLGYTDMIPTVQFVDNSYFNVYIRNLDKAVPMIPVDVSYIAIGR